MLPTVALTFAMNTSEKPAGGFFPPTLCENEWRKRRLQIALEMEAGSSMNVYRDVRDGGTAHDVAGESSAD